MRLFFLLLLAVLPLFAQELDKVIQSKGRNLLQSKRDNFLQDLNLQRLTWNSADKSQVRYSQSVSGEVFTFCGIQIVEAVFYFGEDKELERMDVSLYNRGDCGVWPQAKFDVTVKELLKEIAAFTKVRQYEKSKQRLDSGKLNQALWHAPGYDISLRWCDSNDKPEYITVNVDGHNAIQKLRQDLKASVKTGELSNSVKKEVDGTRWIDVPMVNQGDKGYCVVAVLERLMKYYNSSIDQHIIAQMVNADPKMGTDLFYAMDALEKSASKLRVHIKTVYKEDTFSQIDGLNELINDYNKLVNKKNRLDQKKIAASHYAPEVLFAEMNLKLFIDCRQKRRPGSKHFLQNIKNSIDKGIPLVWTVIVLPNTLPQQSTASFHARLINGYNSKTGDIIYTDSWGPGHEKKTMKLNEAWGITTNLLSVRP